MPPKLVAEMTKEERKAYFDWLVIQKEMEEQMGKEQSGQKHCGECRHFIGGGDWNLCCDVAGWLCYEYSEACGNYEYSEETVRRREEQKNALRKYVAEATERAKEESLMSVKGE